MDELLGNVIVVVIVCLGVYLLIRQRRKRLSVPTSVICRWCGGSGRNPNPKIMALTARRYTTPAEETCDCEAGVELRRQLEEQRYGKRRAQRLSTDAAIGTPQRKVRHSGVSREPRVNMVLAPGDRIVHPVFGEGEVLAVQGEGEKAEATVRFDARGIKVLAVAWAPIVRVE